ncbi:MAG: YncE family protein [Cyclobacteriaceae bacterium]
MNYTSQSNNMIKINGLALLMLGLIIACNREDPEPVGEFDNGILVLNEGAFLAGNASVSFIDAEGEVSTSAFSDANEGLALGDVAQSMIETDHHFIIIVNNSNHLFALNKSDLSIDYAIETLLLPRHVATNKDTGFVTEWVSFTEEGRVTAFDLSSGEILAQQVAGFGAEFPLLDDGKLYVTNSFESTLTILDQETLSILAEIQTGPSPTQLVKTDNGNLLVVCTADFDENFAPANNGVIQQISNDEIAITVNLNINVGARIAIERNSIFYFAGSSVYEFVTEEDQINQVLSDDKVTGYYTISIDETGSIYMSDNKGFQGVGEIIKYTAGGLRDKVYSVGIGPNTILIGEVR